MSLKIDRKLQEGVEAHKAGKVQEASLLYKDILKSQPKHPHANHNMGLIAIGTDKGDEALRYFKTAIKANPDIAQFWLSYLHALIKLDHLKDARAILTKAKKRGVKGRVFDMLKSKLEEPKHKLGKTLYHVEEDKLRKLINLYNSGKLKNAMEQSQKLAVMYPNSAILLNIQGAVLKGLGKLEEAIQTYEKALLIEPNYAEVFNNMGVALKEQGKLNAAVQAYKEAISKLPEYADAYNNLGSAYREQGNFEDAIKAYKKSLSISPDYLKAYHNMGITQKEQGKLEDAIQTYEKALLIDPNYAEAYNNIGVILKEQGKLEEAIQAYKKSLSIFPNYADAHVNMGNAFKEQGKLAGAIKSYRHALSIKPSHTFAMKNLVKMPVGCLRQDDLACLNNIFKENSSNFKSLIDREFFEAGYHMHIGETDSAFSKFRIANKIKLSTLGSILDNFGEVAKNHIQKIKQWEPGPLPKNDISLKKIFILGPSCSGKSTLEAILSKNPKIKPLFESHKIIPNDNSKLKVGGKLNFESVFFENENKLIKKGYKAVTATDPDLLHLAPVLFDKLPNTYFIFIDRDQKNIAPEIFTKDYENGHYYSYDPVKILDYLHFYRTAVDILEEKRLPTLCRISFEQIVEDPVKVIETVSNFTSLDFSLIDFDFSYLKLSNNNIFSSHFETIINEGLL